MPRTHWGRARQFDRQAREARDLGHYSTASLLYGRAADEWSRSARGWLVLSLAGFTVTLVCNVIGAFH